MAPSLISEPHWSFWVVCSKSPLPWIFEIQQGRVGLRNPQKWGFWPQTKCDKTQIPKEIPIYEDSDPVPNMPLESHTTTRVAQQKRGKKYSHELKTREYSYHKTMTKHNGSQIEVKSNEVKHIVLGPPY